DGRQSALEKVAEQLRSVWPSVPHRAVVGPEAALRIRDEALDAVPDGEDDVLVVVVVVVATCRDPLLDEPEEPLPLVLVERGDRLVQPGVDLGVTDTGPVVLGDRARVVPAIEDAVGSGVLA